MPVYQYAISDPATVAHGTGTISAGATSTAVTGSGTSFTTQLHVGDVIVSSGQTLAIALITDNTHLTLQSATVGSISGATFDYYNLTNLESLEATFPAAPRSVPKPWYQGVDTGDGLARGMGRQVTTWEWGYVNQKFRDKLRTIIPGKSLRTFVRSRQIDSADSFLTYQAAVLWPDAEQREATRRLSFAVEIRDMVIL